MDALSRGTVAAFAQPPNVKISPAVPETVAVCVYRFETVLYDLISLVRYKNPAFIYLDLFRKYRCELPA